MAIIYPFSENVAQNGYRVNIFGENCLPLMVWFKSVSEKNTTYCAGQKIKKRLAYKCL